MSKRNSIQWLLTRMTQMDYFIGNDLLTAFEKAKEMYGPDAAELHVVKMLEDKVGLLLRPPHGEAIEPVNHGT